jgi:hypothetical protein
MRCIATAKRYTYTAERNTHTYTNKRPMDTKSDEQALAIRTIMFHRPCVSGPHANLPTKALRKGGLSGFHGSLRVPSLRDCLRVPSLRDCVRVRAPPLRDCVVQTT